MYEVIFDPDAIEFLQKAEKKIAKRIWDKIMATKSDPHHFFERLTGRTDHKLRIGDYRVLYDIDDKKKTVWIFNLRRRSERTYK